MTRRGVMRNCVSTSRGRSDGKNVFVRGVRRTVRLLNKRTHLRFNEDFSIEEGTHFSPVRIVIGIAPYAEMPVNACPPLRDFKGRVVRMQFPLVLLALADLVQRELLDAFLRTVAAQQHLDQLVHGGLLGHQQTLVFRL